MNKKSLSEAVCAACWILFLVVAFAECATAQTVEMRHGSRRIPWNNHAYFESRPKTAALNWGDYLESWDGKTFATWGAFAVAGVSWGMREAYHAEPTVFERAWGVSDRSFFGSEAWVRNYQGNDPDRPHKSELFGNVGRDIHHTFGFGSKVVLVGGTFTIGARRQPLKYRVVNAVIAWGVHSIFATASYQALR